MARTSLQEGGAKVFAKWLLLIAFLVAGGLYLALDRIALLAFRFLTLAEQGGGERVDQVSFALSLIDSWATLLSGVGNAVQRTQGISHGVEVEPIYLLVNYGLIGAGLRYGLLLVIAACSLRALKSPHIWESAAGMGTLMAVAGYTVFSLGYFFFQELYVGVIPWLLFGIVAGIYQREWSLKHAHRSDCFGLHGISVSGDDSVSKAGQGYVVLGLVPTAATRRLRSHGG